MIAKKENEERLIFFDEIPKPSTSGLGIAYEESVDAA